MRVVLFLAAAAAVSSAARTGLHAPATSAQAFTTWTEMMPATPTLTSKQHEALTNSAWSSLTQSSGIHKTGKQAAASFASARNRRSYGGGHSQGGHHQGGYTPAYNGGGSNYGGGSQSSASASSNGGGYSSAQSYSSAGNGGHSSAQSYSSAGNGGYSSASSSASSGGYRSAAHRQASHAGSRQHQSQHRGQQASNAATVHWGSRADAAIGGQQYQHGQHGQHGQNYPGSQQGGNYPPQNRPCGYGYRPIRPQFPPPSYEGASGYDRSLLDTLYSTYWWN